MKGKGAKLGGDGEHEGEGSLTGWLAGWLLGEMNV